MKVTKVILETFLFQEFSPSFRLRLLPRFRPCSNGIDRTPDPAAPHSVAPIAAATAAAREHALLDSDSAAETPALHTHTSTLRALMHARTHKLHASPTRYCSRHARIGFVHLRTHARACMQHTRQRVCTHERIMRAQARTLHMHACVLHTRVRQTSDCKGPA